jgi:hypothetical protein
LQEARRHKVRLFSGPVRTAIPIGRSAAVSSTAAVDLHRYANVELAFLSAHDSLSRMVSIHGPVRLQPCSWRFGFAAPYASAGSVCMAFSVLRGGDAVTFSSHPSVTCVINRVTDHDEMEGSL